MKEYMLDDFIKGEVNSDFISVKEYTLSYGHNGKYIKVIRSRFDSNNEKIIKFYLIKLNLITLSEEGIFNMLYPYSDNINKFALKNYFKLESVYIDLDKIQKRIDSLELVPDDFIYVDSKELEFVNRYNVDSLIKENE